MFNFQDCVYGIKIWNSIANNFNSFCHRNSQKVHEEKGKEIEHENPGCAVVKQEELKRLSTDFIFVLT